jgi:taurine dioxygenase
MYGKGDTGRSMDIRPSDDAQATQTHPIIRTHPETGRQSLFGCAGYIVGIEGMDQQEGWDLITEIYRWQTRPEFQYRHKWSPDMLVMWDNRCTLHMATGGYAGHDRLLHRTTIGAA